MVKVWLSGAEFKMVKVPDRSGKPTPTLCRWHVATIKWSAPGACRLLVYDTSISRIRGAVGAVGAVGGHRPRIDCRSLSQGS